MREHEGPGEPVDAPLVPASVSLPEITPKAVVLSVLLAAVLAGANAYLGLFAGMTVSASIPAAVVSMAVLRLFRQSNILENNIVQTAASSGEALAAGVIFTIPGLVLIGYWTSFDYWQTFTVSLVGGVLGVLFTIPLRRAYRRRRRAATVSNPDTRHRHGPDTNPEEPRMDAVSPTLINLIIFVLAIYVGYHVVWTVTPALHTPLMAVTNAISAIVIVGAMLAAALTEGTFGKLLGVAAVALAAVNIFGGFLVTRRMLEMFKKKDRPAKADAAK